MTAAPCPQREAFVLTTCAANDYQARAVQTHKLRAGMMVAALHDAGSQ